MAIFVRMWYMLKEVELTYKEDKTCDGRVNDDLIFNVLTLYDALNLDGWDTKMLFSEHI